MVSSLMTWGLSLISALPPKADIYWITGFNLLYLPERDAAVGYPHLLTLACRCYTNLGGIFAM